MKQLKAIAFCRVSTAEQLLGGSLNRQEKAVLKTAEELGVVVPKEYWWSGNVSSKRGTNLKRKDLNEALAVCKRDKSIKYAIVDEPDRFMRSIDEAMYFEVVFRELGVKVYYANDPELNTDSMSAKLMKFLHYFKAEGSNEERQNKSIAGLRESLLLGKYPFQPPAGYQKGRISGIPEIDPVRGLLLRQAMLSIVDRRATPAEALAWLNTTDFVKGKSKYKMDKFRKLCTNPFYAGVVEMHKQVDIRNENGLHEPLITMDEHLQLVDIFTKKKKNQSGPRKNGNPEYPLSNIVSCLKCQDKKYHRYVGFKVNNGVNKKLIYHKYRCRSCGHYFTRDELHMKAMMCLYRQDMTNDGKKLLVSSLNRIWTERRKSSSLEKAQMRRDIQTLEKQIDELVEAAIAPQNSPIKDDIMKKIATHKNKLVELEDRIESLEDINKQDKAQFMEFALERAEQMWRHFLQLPKDKLLQCKQLLIPAGFWVDENENVYTPEISVLYRLATNKKDLSELEKSFMVRVRRL